MNSEASRRSRSARQRGKRAEYSLRNYLRLLGWSAERVPTSGASRAMKGDVIAKKGGVELTFEVKSHNGRFTQFWPMLDEFQAVYHSKLLSTDAAEFGGGIVDISTDLDLLLAPPDLYLLPGNIRISSTWLRTLRRLPTLYRMLGESDILVIHDNRKPFIFLRFR